MSILHRYNTYLGDDLRNIIKEELYAFLFQWPFVSETNVAPFLFKVHVSYALKVYDIVIDSDLPSELQL
jgi:hypothetical protein